MKKKIVFVVLAFLLVLQAQTVFAGPDDDFVKELNRNNIGNIEKLLQRKAKEMNLAYCMNVAIKPSNWKGTENYNKSNCLDVVKLLVRYGADVNRQHFSSYGTDYGRPLQIAIEKQLDISVIRFLLDSGAKTDFNAANWKDEKGSPIPFIVMAYVSINNNNGNMEIINLLLDHGAKGELILPDLASSGNNELIKRLITKGVQIRSEQGAIALRYAAFNGKFDTVKLLVENGVNVNARASEGDNYIPLGATAASVAYDKGEMDIYDYLKANGARDFEPRQVTQQPTAPAQSTTNVYVQPSAPSPSSSSSSNTPSRNVGREIADSFKSPLQSGTYSLVGSQEKISIAAIAKSGGLHPIRFTQLSDFI